MKSIPSVRHCRLWLLALLVIALAAASSASTQVDFDLPATVGFGPALTNAARTDPAAVPVTRARARAPATTRD